ncbi:unnamed protein product [Ceutorhynchus assimilis]|uniref:YqaJ viral recombinase domain-containing protein n=1 Tax=Ceutorhynchus assimilis TaxID=467358 RepID=A0A9N9MEV6_9CUCU|nr:unnamed protein product [Ceutorhynchus assimilis]
MENAAAKEAELALEEGDVDENGITCITVVTDGAWAKRSYNVNYDSMSGVACIIGYRTGNLLFLGIRNKYCSLCSYYENKGQDIPIHKCYKNWQGTSTSMETDIIAEGFKNSIKLHKLKYTKMVGDGDSSVYRKLIQIKPYGNTLVQKVECKNHLLRNFAKKIREICNKNRSNKNIAVSMALRKEIFSKFMRLRTAITKATAYRISENNTIDEKINLLRGDISNSPSHVFGEHSKCKELNYFKCNNLNEKNLIPAMKECGIYDDIMLALKRLLDNTSSLILNMDNNLAEHYNSVVYVKSQEYLEKAEDFLNNLKKTAEEIHCIDRNTIGQSANPCWIQERAVRITASNFGKICKMRPQTSRATTVKTLLYGNFHGNTATRYGNDSEARAIAEFEDKYKVKISQCGLFIDKKNYYLGASPDGLIGDTQLMEIKCPYSICNMNPAEAIKEKKLAFAEFVDNEFHLKRNHNYYYQIQGQLAIADKQMCYFVVGSPHGMVVEEVSCYIIFCGTYLFK